jgi:hypothetical protein
MLDGFTDADMQQFGLIQPGQSPAQARRFLATQREAAIDLMVESQLDGNVTARMDKEQEWYTITKTFMPPVEFWSRHPGYEKFSQFKRGQTTLSKQVKLAVSQIAQHRACLTVIVR